MKLFNVNECSWETGDKNPNNLYFTEEQYEHMLNYFLVNPDNSMINSFLQSLKELAKVYSFLYGDTLGMKSEEVYKMMLKELA